MDGLRVRDIIKPVPSATYLYCVVKTAKKPSLAGVPAGIPAGSPVEVARVDDALWVVSSSVPFDIYGPGRLESALRDLDWVGRIAVAHEAVVEHFADRKDMTVVPMKLFTMFSTPQKAIEEMTVRRASIDATVRKIAGAEEWGIRVIKGETAPEQQTAAGSPAASGAAFLAAKKQKRDDARMARAAAAEAAMSAYERLAAIAKAVRRREEAPPAGATPPLLDAAFLVPAARREKFTAAARREAAACARAGAQLTLSGPWPAYNFIAGEER